MSFNEDSRVKIPAILHLVRLGFSYVSLRNIEWDSETNIVGDSFADGIKALNPYASAEDVKRALAEIELNLDNEDLGKKFYERISKTSLETSQLHC